jgi:hypothetical protein
MYVLVYHLADGSAEVIHVLVYRFADRFVVEVKYVQYLSANFKVVL